MFNSHRLIAQTVGRTWGAVISKTSKTAPKLAQKPAKIREKVAETAETPKQLKNKACFLYLYRAFKQMETIISAFEEKWEKEM